MFVNAVNLKEWGLTKLTKSFRLIFIIPEFCVIITFFNQEKRIIITSHISTSHIWRKPSYAKFRYNRKLILIKKQPRAHIYPHESNYIIYYLQFYTASMCEFFIWRARFVFLSFYFNKCDLQFQKWLAKKRDNYTRHRFKCDNSTIEHQQETALRNMAS